MQLGTECPHPTAEMQLERLCTLNRFVALFLSKVVFTLIATIVLVVIL
jgi:hypothetical protein